MNAPAAASAHRRFAMAVLLAGAALSSSPQCLAREPEVRSTRCATVADDAIAWQGTCTATQAGGAGVSVLTYRLRDGEHEIVSDDSGETLDGAPYATYARDARFRRTDLAADMAWFCYRGERIEFCARQP